MHQRRRWAVVAVLLAAGWLVGPGGVPLYDGLGVPDEPYRFVPPRGDDARQATTAQIVLELTAGRNPGGLVAISAEAGPQVTVYAPPQAFAVPRAGSGQLVVRAEAIALERPSPGGELESNVYRLTLTSNAGPVTLRPEAQPPLITLRGVTPDSPVPVVMQHRTAAGQGWRPLPTRKVGLHSFTADIPGAGEYVLVRSGAAARDGDGAGLLPALVLAGVLGVAVAAGVRVLNRRGP